MLRYLKDIQKILKGIKNVFRIFLYACCVRYICTSQIKGKMFIKIHILDIPIYPIVTFRCINLLEKKYYLYKFYYV